MHTSVNGVCLDGKNKDGSAHHLPVTLQECNLILDYVQQEMNVRSDVITRLVDKLQKEIEQDVVDVTGSSVWAR